MTKKKDKEVVEEITDAKEDVHPESWEGVKTDGLTSKDDAIKIGQEILVKKIDASPIDILIDPASKDDTIKLGPETLDEILEHAKRGKESTEDSEGEVSTIGGTKLILNALERLETKFDLTFNNHTLVHGRFRRGRKTLNR